MGNIAPPEIVLASASGSKDGAGKIGTIAATTGTLRVRLDNTGFGRTNHVDWRVKSDKAYGVQLYRCRTMADSATITLAAATRVDDADPFILNGLTYTAESTGADAAWASRKWLSGGASESADAAQLAALINADYAITPNGSVSVGDTITVNTIDGAFTYTAAATPSYTTRVFDQSGNQAAELASIVLALNHRRNVTLASCAAGTTVSIVGQNGIRYTFTAHTDTTTEANREFSISGNDAADAAALVTCINNATYGVPGYTATAVSNAVHIARNTRDVPEPVITSSNSTTAACVNTAGGVPGVTAVATGATGELGITPVWDSLLTVTTSNNTRLALVDIDIPGIAASVSSAVITLSCSSAGVKAPVIQFAQSTSDAAEIAFADTTLASLVLHGAAVTGKALNSSTAGETFEQWIDGWDYGYIVVSNGTGDAQTVTVAATRY